MSLFLDTSGLLACFLDFGRPTVALRRAWREEKVVVISMHADLEFMFEINQMQLSGHREADCLAVAAAYQTTSTDFIRRTTDSLYLKAAILGIQHSLPPGPSIHLAVALEFKEQILHQFSRAKDPVVFGTLNPELASAALREGFRVVPAKRVAKG